SRGTLEISLCTMARKCESNFKPLVQNITEPESIARFLESSFKNSKVIQVWPLSKQTLRQELSVVANALLLYTAVKSSAICHNLPELCRMEQLLCQSLDRAFQFMSESPSHLWSIGRERSITELMQRILGALKDPIIHFRSLDVLGSIVTVCGLACLFVRAHSDKTEVQPMILVFQDITNTLCKDTLQQPLPYKNGRLEEEEFPEDSKPEDFPCLQDFVNTVLCLHPNDARATRVVYKPWQWLDIICLCKEYMSKQEYSSAMEHLEGLLNTPLDPEIRSAVLCLFAQCYLHQDCSQLALQTYKKALKADQDNHLVFFYLAEVYKLLKQEDLELESLSLLVKVLTHKHLGSKTLTPDLHLDALVFSLCDALPSVKLPETLHHFAQRCVELHRYTEATEQYLTLLRLLEEDLECTSVSSIHGDNRPVDVQEIVVEAAEALALAKQTEQCLRLVEKFLPVFAANDTIYLSSSNLADSNISGAGLNDSQDSLLGSQLNIESPRCSVSLQREREKLERVDSFSKSHEFENLCISTQRKRLRSSSFLMDDDERSQHKGPGKDRWWSSSLVVRLLLSKADVLIPNEGYSEGVIRCLYR
ncbi:fanconi anemia group G protein, partial [Elysia marginata]